jgi:hypothetical protein
MDGWVYLAEFASPHREDGCGAVNHSGGKLRGKFFDDGDLVSASGKLRR